MYPAGAPPKADAWTFDAFLKAAEACHKGGHPFGIGVGTTGDNVDTAGAIFNGFGAMLVDAKGDITVKSDAVREALDYYKRLMAFLPTDAPSWDDASNNKFLISGQGALIMNPPSAWAVAKRDAPKVAEQLWTHGFAAGPKGRYAPFVPFFWGIWNFSKNQAAAKSLIVRLSQADAVEKMVIASGGYDLPSFANFTTFKVWAEEGPPPGTLYHYPNPYNHQILSIAGAPAPHKFGQPIGVQALQTQMAVRHYKGEAMEKTLDWAASELEGFMRN
jgi:ABC-type glycerol-3-phosphate transport system substrate-binding protein